MCKSDQVIGFGSYFRKSDQLTLHRYRCKKCLKTFSEATGDFYFAQKKRQINHQIHELLAMGMSQNNIARFLRTTRPTVARKLICQGTISAYWNYELNLQAPKAKNIQFDEMETFEHSLCKPLSIALAVDKPSRRILGIEVSLMPANGPLAKKSVEKYGKRPDHRIPGMTAMFQRMISNCTPKIKLASDKCPRYASIVKKTFGAVKGRIVEYIQYKGARGASTGQGELKRIRYDPLFHLNHTCAMMRSNVNRLIRRTWCTTKKMSRLVMHLEIFSYYHNTCLLAKKHNKRPVNNVHTCADAIFSSCLEKLKSAMPTNTISST